MVIVVPRQRHPEVVVNITQGLQILKWEQYTNSSRYPSVLSVSLE